jgi:hypothetical protein
MCTIHCVQHQEAETVAATVHILYLITHADVMRGTLEREVERHFTGKAVATVTTDSNSTTTTAAATASATAGVVSPTRPPAAATATVAVRKASVTNSDSTATAAATTNGNSSSDNSAMLSDADLYSGRVVGSLFRVLQTHMDRKDIVRAGMRSLSNLVRLEPIRSALLRELAR